MVSNLAVLIPFLLALVACSSLPTRNETTNIDKASVDANKANTKSNDRNVDIEIWQELDGSVPVKGRSLYFRMYTNGSVEFDHLKREENRLVSPPITFFLERTLPFPITAEESKRIESLLKNLAKDKEVEPEYKSVALTLDVETRLIVHLKPNTELEKQIIINDSDLDIISDKFSKRFPSLLIELIRETHLVRKARIPVKE